MTTTPLGEARNKLSELVDRVHREHERVGISVHGRTKAVLLSAEDLEAMEETIEILSDPQTMANLRESAADIAEGRTVAWESVRGEIRAGR